VVFDLQDPAVVAGKAGVSNVRTMAPWLEGIGPGAHHHGWIARSWADTYDTKREEEAKRIRAGWARLSWEFRPS
jgi:hypothetical protein